MNLPKSNGTIENVVPDFERLTLADYVDEDPRPSFVLDLNSNIDILNSTLHITFTNKAYRAANIKLEHAIRRAQGSTATGSVDFSTTAFAVWAKRAQQTGFFQYQGRSWITTTLFSRWRIITGELTTSEHAEAEAGRAKKSESYPNNKRSKFASNVVQNISLPERRKLGGLKSSPLDLLIFPDAASQEHCYFVQDFDWSQTSLGSMQDWSPTILTIIMHMLSSSDPCVIFWGPERTIVYNEPYTSLIGALHPTALGASAKVKFGPFWQPFEKLIQGIEQSGCAAKQDTYRSLLNRSGVVEELWFRGTFVPISNLDGQICGIFNHVVEITNEIMSSRRMNTLLKVTEETSTMIAPDRLWQGILASMQTCVDDLPFVAIYSTGQEFHVFDLTDNNSAHVNDSGNWFLQGSVGFPRTHSAVLSTLSLQQDSGLAPALRLLLAANTRHPLMFQEKDGRLPLELFHIDTDPEHEVRISEIVLCSLSPSSGRNTVCLVLAIPAEQRYDEDYQQFVSLLSHRLEDMATSAFLLQKERIRTEQAVAEAERQQEWLSKQLEQQTKEAQASDFRFYNFAKHAPVAVYIIGPEGDIRFGNNAWYDLLNLSPDDKSPLSWRRHIHPDDLQKCDMHWEQMRNGDGQRSVEFRVVKDLSSGDGITNTSYLRATAFPELDEDGRMKSVTGIIMDWSAQKAQELAVVDRLAEALEAKRTQENFMDMVSHEMRNPLSAMLQCAEEISQALSAVSTETCVDALFMSSLSIMKEAVDTIQWCGKHQRQIIDDVLTVSKLDSGLLTLAPVATMPADIVEKVLKMFASEAKAADVLMSPSISPDSKRHFYAFDSSRVLQILINLVGNAIKFTKGRPIRKLELSVSVWSKEPQIPGTRFVLSDRQRRRLPTAADPANIRYIFFTVEDTGPGITPAEMESLFARFKQASPRTHAQYGGSGLGLFISRELAEMHGGKIGLNSKVGIGSTLSFYIKTHIVANHIDDTAKTLLTGEKGRNTVDTIERSKIKIPPGIAPSPARMTLLIVEDNLINQKVLVRQISKLGFQTVTANHGQEALTIVEKSTWWRDRKADAIDISVILCDLEMPVMDGMTCIQRIRQWQADGALKAHIPAIAVTGNARTEQVKAARDAGFDDVVCKPYSVADLVPVINDLMIHNRHT